jgi:hypothetical protein
MSGRIEGVWRRGRAAIGALALLTTLALALPAIAAACIEDGGGEDRGPLIGAAQITPSSFSFEGGTAVVSGEVEDDCGIDHVRAEVADTEGGLAWSFPLLPDKVVNANTVLYRGEIQLPPNYREAPARYLAVIEAEDTNGSIEYGYVGEVEVAGLPPFDEAPYVSAATLSPRLLGSAGGEVTIAADAADNRAIANVFAIVTLPDGTEKEVQLEAVSASHFESAFQAPANLGPTPDEYAVMVYAEDDIGQQSSESAGGFVVSPPSGRLVVRPPSERFFGSVAIGDSATRVIVVHNNGRPGTRPVEAAITTSGPPFSLRGAADGRIDFALDPGKTRSFAVDFTPTSPAMAAGAAIVSRPDAAQAEISVGLSGQGVARRRR